VNRKGPANVKLDLLLNDQIVSSTKSANDGSYYFSNIMPGDYQVQASHPKWKFKVDKVSVTLSKDNWSAKDNIVVSGYTIEGYVLSADKKPLQNAIVTLKLSSGNLADIDPSNFECEKSEKILEGNEICHVRTNDKGKYEFNNIAFQKYSLQAVYRLLDSIVVFSKPDGITVELVKHDNLVVNEKFELNFLNLNPKAVIVDSTNNQELPFVDAKVFINDKEVQNVRTDRLGEFKLAGLVHGVGYKVTLKADHVYFEEKTILIDLSAKSMQETVNAVKNFAKFSVKSFDVCGKIKFKQEIKSSDLVRLAKIIRLKVFQYLPNGIEEVNVRYIKIDENLSYCFKLNKSPIEYIVKIDITNVAGGANADLETFLKFISDEKRVYMNKEAVLDLNFEQFDAELSGTVEFLSANDDGEFKCPVDFKLHLKSMSKGDFINQITDLKCNPAKKQLEFQIKNVLYGQYYLVNNYDHVFCWNLVDSRAKISNHNALVLNVNKEKEIVHLKQFGYKLAYTFHDLNVDFSLKNSKNEMIGEKKLSSQSDLTGSFCINDINQNLFIEFDSCHLLKPVINVENIKELSVNKYEINTKSLFSSTTNKIEFKSSHHILKIEVTTKLDKNINENDLTNDYKEIEIYVYEIIGPTSASEEEIIQDREANEKILLQNPVFTRTEASSQLKFTSKSWLSADKTYLFKPISKKYLFTPSFNKYKIDPVNCNSNRFKFSSKLGLFIKGLIQPSTIEAVEVRLKSFDNTTLYQSEAVDTNTGFYLGPFESEKNEDILDKYSIEVAKSGYLFKLLSKKIQNGEYLLEYFGEKLGELRIVVQESARKQNLENVLVSLSSSNKLYRKIIKTNSNGVALFDNLEADVYYLLVMMQEYEFMPNSQIINVTSGFTSTIGVDAKRVAYSCYGKVSTINGLSIGDVIIEATGFDDGNDNLNCKQSQENTKSDNETGVYRIRGLKPGCKYDISVKQTVGNDASGYLYKIIPQSYHVDVKEGDILDLNFLLIDNLTLTSEISLKINLFSSKSPDSNAETIQKSYRNNVRIKLYKLAHPDSILQSFIIPSNSIFYLPRLARDNQQYLLQVELLTPTATVSAMSAQQQQQQQQQQVAVLDRDEVVFQTDKLFKQLVVNFDLNVKKNSAYASSGSYFDAHGQQYQTIYFTLPLFLVILAIVYFKFKDLNDLVKLIRQKIDNGGFLSSVPKGNVQKSNQKVSKQQQQQQQQQQQKISDKSSNELDSSSNSSIDVIDNEGNSVTPKRVRVRKA
jgi:hypothetical protein